MNAVIKEIQRLNAESAAWMAEKEGRWAGMLTEDPQHWEEYGIRTVEQLNDYFDACFQREVEKGNFGEEEGNWSPDASEDDIAKWSAPITAASFADVWPS